MGEKICAIFISRYCIDSTFSTSKDVEELFLRNNFMFVNENLNFLHTVLKIQKLIQVSSYYHVAECLFLDRFSRHDLGLLSIPGISCIVWKFGVNLVRRREISIKLSIECSFLRT